MIAFVKATSEYNAIDIANMDHLHHGPTSRYVSGSSSSSFPMGLATIDPYEKMLRHITGRVERSSREKAIKFPVKVRTVSNDDK